SGAWHHATDANRARGADVETGEETGLMAKVDTDGSKAGKRAFTALLIFAVLSVLLFALAPDDLYLWIKALHVIAVISWMAGMLYLPRLFVYHADCEKGSPQSETF